MRARDAETTRRRHARHVAEIAVGAGLLGLGTLLLEDARDRVPRWEQDLFASINDLPEFLKPVLLVEMQLGSFWAIPVASLGMLAWRKPRGALTAAVAGFAAWMLAKVVKNQVERGRPFELLAGVHVRESGITGLGFVSGHTAVSFALATAITPWLKGKWRLLPLALASCVGFARIYVGAHLPLDVLGGAGVGIACGSLSAWAFGRPHDRTLPSTSTSR